MLLNAEEIISKSWRDYVANFHDWAIYSLILFIPGFVLTLSGSFGGFLNTYLPSTSIPTNILIVILAIAAGLMWAWSTLALVHAIGKYLEIKQTDQWKEHYVAALYKIWPAFYTSLLKGVIVFAGTLLLIVPGIIFSVWYAFILYGVLLADERGWQALESSKKLVQGRWWGVVWRLLLPGLVFGLGFAAVNIVATLLFKVFPLSDESYLLISNILGSLLSAIFAPLTLIASLNLYYSLRDNPMQTSPVQPPTT